MMSRVSFAQHNSSISLLILPQNVPRVWTYYVAGRSRFMEDTFRAELVLLEGQSERAFRSGCFRRSCWSRRRCVRRKLSWSRQVSIPTCRQRRDTSVDDHGCCSIVPVDVGTKCDLPISFLSDKPQTQLGVMQNIPGVAFAAMEQVEASERRPAFSQALMRNLLPCRAVHLQQALASRTMLCATQCSDRSRHARTYVGEVPCRRGNRG